ncbi:hypothetical protein [uncultured Salinisphaera sp.]|tara:strand:- start:832 stop:954 length:123 start_codon:yes stop_codon:yes gene_type:complete
MKQRPAPAPGVFIEKAFHFHDTEGLVATAIDLIYNRDSRL